MRTSSPFETHWRKALFLVIVCGVALVGIERGVFALPGAVPTDVEPVPLRTIPNTDVNPFGANFFLQWEPEQWKVERTLQMAGEAGIGWAKQQFPWEDIELKKDSFWDDRLKKSTWEKYDRIVQLAEKYNIKIIARLDRPPGWTRKDNSHREAPPDNLQDYRDFVEVVVNRYKGRIHHYQIWNEPNIFPEWGNRPINPEEYVELLRVGYEAVKRVDPNAYVLSAPLAQTTENSPRAMADIDFLAKMYEHGAGRYFDILFANAYGFSLPPDDAPDPGVLNFQRIELLRSVMVANGDEGKAVWFNEFGWDSPPPGFPPDKLIWGAVSEQQQVDYTVEAIDMARKKWPWVGVFSIWYFRQDGHILPDRADYYFRMVDVGFTPRPLYNAIKSRAAQVQQPAPAGDYQETNPALRKEGKWQILQDSRASAGAAIVSTNPDDNVTITFEGTGFGLLLRKGPNGGRLFVTVDGRSPNKLPRDSQDRSYVDQSNSSEQWQAHVDVASGLAEGEHRVRLVVAQPTNPGTDAAVVIDGFTVRAEVMPLWRNLTPFAAAAALALLAILWWRRKTSPSSLRRADLKGSE